MQLLRNSRSNIDELENVENRELQNGSPVVVTTWREAVSILAVIPGMLDEAIKLILLLYNYYMFYHEHVE